MNGYAIRAIYHFELARWFRTLVQSVAVAGDLDLAVLRRVRRGDRLAHGARSTASATARSSCPA